MTCIQPQQAVVQLIVWEILASSSLSKPTRLDLSTLFVVFDYLILLECSLFVVFVLCLALQHMMQLQLILFLARVVIR